MQTDKHYQHKIGLEIRMFLWGFKTGFCSVTTVEQKHGIWQTCWNGRLVVIVIECCDCRGFREAEFGVNAASY